MKKSIKTILMTIALTTTCIFAGDGHSHDEHGGHSHQADVNQTIAEKKAIKIVKSFVKKEVIAKSWAETKVDTAEKKVMHGHKEWVVIFINNKIEEKEKQKLYVFLTPSGKYIAANYTGK